RRLAERVDSPPGDAVGGGVHDGRMRGHGRDLRDAGAHGAGCGYRDGRGPADAGHRHSGTAGAGGGSGSACMMTAAWARSSTRRILPVEVVGYSVTNTIRRGRLNDGRPVPPNPISGSSSAAPPGVSCTDATRLPPP